MTGFDDQGFTPEEKEMISAARICLDRNIPFALYSMPGTRALEFVCDEQTERRLPDFDAEGDCFFISRFNGDEPYVAGICSGVTPSEVCQKYIREDRFSEMAPDEFPYIISTVKPSWEKAFRMMHRRLKKVGGKVVLSAHISVFSPRDVIDVALEYMLLNPANFGYICYTRENGIWYGSTPELLLEHNNLTGEYRTMALAGTRWDTSIPWDEKNIIEHETVVNYILLTLSECGVEAERGKRVNVVTNGVEHLMTPITGKGDVPFSVVVEQLNPTPAVAGEPLWLALMEIDTFEAHQRRCYSGFVGVKNGDKISAYVNLRCAFAAQARYGNGDDEVMQGFVHNLYAGGGIMADSDMETEWEEVKRKSNALLKVISSGVPDKSVIYNPTLAGFCNTNSLTSSSYL